MAIGKATGLALTVGLFTAACGGQTESPTSPTRPTSTRTYAFLSVSVNPSLIQPGETANASVVGWTTENGTPIYGPIPVTRWTSSNSSVATVSASGLVTAVTSGTAVLSGTFDGGTLAGTVSVFADRDIQGLLVTCPDIPPSAAGVFCQVVARTPLGNGPVKATWTSSRPEVASLANPGSPPSSTIVLVANAPGQTVVTATYGAFQATATVDVAR